MQEALVTIGVVAAIALAVMVVGRFLAARLPEQLGQLVSQLTPVLIIGVVVVGILIIIDPDQADVLLESSIRSVPRIMIAIIVVMIARALGRILGLFAETALRRVSAVVAARARLILSAAVMGVGLIIALQQLGISTDIILILVSALAFGTALAIALAAGLGSLPMARQIAAGRHVQNRYEEGDVVRVGVVEGKVESIGMATTRLALETGTTVDVPNEEFLKGAVTVDAAATAD